MSIFYVNIVLGILMCNQHEINFLIFIFHSNAITLELNNRTDNFRGLGFMCLLCQKVGLLYFGWKY